MKKEILIQNSNISATVSTMGAELKSLKQVKSNTEYLWSSDPRFWARSAPILFPIVGKMRQNQYTHNGLSYSMPQHGFARDSEFNIVNQDKSSATLELESSDKTFPSYPFKFYLIINFTLEDDSLKVAYTVKNIDDKTIYFSIGSHPAFNVTKGSKVIFENIEDGPYYLDDGFVDFTAKQQQTKEIEINSNTFKNDALIFKNLKSREVRLMDSNDITQISMKFNQTPYLGIWSPVNAPFVCIEPWHGIADTKDHSGELKDKLGINALEAGKEFKTFYVISIP